MRLNNSERQVIVNEIYKQVAEPIEKENADKITKVEIDEESDKYLQDVAKYNVINHTIEDLQEEKHNLNDLYAGNIVNNFKFSYYPFTEGSINQYKNFIKGRIAGVKYVPTRQDIEREIILSGNKDIAELIKTIVEKLKNS